MKRWMTAPASLLFLLVAVAPVAGKDDGVSDIQTQDVKIGSAPVLIVESDAGAVTLKPGSAGTVHVEAEKHAATKEGLAQVQVSVTSEKDGVHLTYKHPSNAANNEWVALKIIAPADTHLQIHTGAGSVSAEGFTGGMSAHTGAGSIQVQHTRGALQLESGAGSIRVTGSEGGLQASTGAGSIAIDGPLSGDNVARTGAGSIHVAVPGDARLAVDADTAIGRVSNDFNLPVQRSAGMGSAIHGSIGGNGGGTLKLHSGVGSISLTRS